MKLITLIIVMLVFNNSLGQVSTDSELHQALAINDSLLFSAGLKTMPSSTIVSRILSPL